MNQDTAKKSVPPTIPFLDMQSVSCEFKPQVSLGDRIAARLGSSIETRSVKAVDKVSLTIERGETVGLVGESGCGKSTLGRLAAGILSPTSGHVLLDGQPIISNGIKNTTRVQTVFQDPFASLDPRMKVGAAIAEGPIAHGLVTKAESGAYVAGWFDEVGLDTSFVNRYPHQFSGGQRQRVAIARALAMKPDLLICDEPVASLDVSIQAQIINLLMDLRDRLGLTCLFISHDLSVVQHVSERLSVMYLGRIVEQGDAHALFDRPAHPYTDALLASIPRLIIDDDDLTSLQPIAGELPSPLSPPHGCHFAPRCVWVKDVCSSEVPVLDFVASTDGIVSARKSMCHYSQLVMQRDSS